MAKASTSSARRKRRQRARSQRDGAGRVIGTLVSIAAVNRFARIILLTLLCAVMFLPGQTALGPSDRDEARFAQASRQMLESGDFVGIRFQDSDRHKKPAGIHWLQSASASLFGGVEAPIWAYRLPSVLGGLLAVVLTVWAFRPLVGSRSAFVAAAMMAGLLLLNVEARIAKTDAMLLAAVVAAQGGLARLWFQTRDDPVEHSWNVLFFWTAMAVGVLIKGPIILLPIGGALAWMIFYDRSLAGLGRLGAAWGLVWFLMLAAPWYVAIGVQTDGAFFQTALGQDLLAKVTEGKEAHGAPPGAYFAAFWATFWPWTPMALVAAPWVWRWKASPEMAFLLGSIVPTWLIFEIAGTKLPHYVLPVYPAIAAIAASCALDGSARPRGALFWIAAALWAVPALALPAAVALAPLAIAGTLEWMAIGLGGAALLVFLAAWRWLTKGIWIGFVRANLIGVALLYAGAFHYALPALEPAWVSERLTATAAPYRACLAGPDGPRPPIAAVGYHEPSLVFLAGTDTRLDSPAAAAQWAAAARGALVWVRSAQVKLEKRLFEIADYAPHDDAPTFRAAMAAAGAEPIELAKLRGFNYTRGRLVELTLYGRADDLALRLCRQRLGDQQAEQQEPGSPS